MRAGGGGAAAGCKGMLGLKLKSLEMAFIVFFLLNRFGSVFSVSGLSNRNRTEPAGFLKILIGFFFGSVFSVIFFPVFSV